MLRNWSLNPLAKVAIGILRKYGADAHVYLPGIGTVSGLTAGNYLDSAGTTAATVDNPVGLGLDALQAMTLGAELVVGASNLGNNGWTPSGSGGVKIASGAIGSLYGPYGSIGPTYLMVVVVSAISGTITPYLGSSPQSVITSPGTYQYVVKPSAGAFFYLDAPAATTATVTSVSVREIPGIHATQATTANKPILRQSGGKYSWQFDGNDSLSLSAPLFQPSDDHCIVGAATCKDAAGQLTIFSTNGNNGRTQFRFNNGQVQFLWLGTTGTNFISPLSYTNVPIVVGAKKVSSVKTSRINGATLNIDSTAVDTVTNSASTIGSWAGANYMNGSLGPIIVIKGTVSDADMLTLERFVGQLSGVSI